MLQQIWIILLKFSISPFGHKLQSIISLNQDAEKLGIEKGIEKGKIETGQELLKEGIDPVIIAKATKLPLEKIKALQKKK